MTETLFRVIVVLGKARGRAAYSGMQAIRATKHNDTRGGLAQLGEHLLCKQGVVGSIPSSSTSPLQGGILKQDAGGQRET